VAFRLSPGVLALFVLSASPYSAEAQPSVNTLVVGAATDHYPYSYLETSGRLTGFAVELLDEVARISGLSLRRVTGSSADLNQRFLAGEFPVAQVFAYAPGRQGRTKFSAPYLTLKGALFVRADSNLDFESVADLSGRSVIVGAGSTGEIFLNRTGVPMSLVPVETADESLRLLAQGRHDAALTSRLTGMAIVTRDGLQNVRPTGPPIDALTVSLCFASHDDDRLIQLNEGLAILYRTGDYERIYRRWFARYEPTSFTRQEVAHYAAGVLFVVAAAAVWVSWQQRRLSHRVASQAYELRRMDSELAQGRRLRAVGEMVGGIAHEFNNLLTPIVLKVEMLRDERRADPALQRELDVIAGAAERAASLTRRLLMFGRKPDHEPGDVRMADVVSANVELVKPTADPRIAIVVDVPDDLPLLRQSASDVHQIVLNLLLNARDTLQDKLERHPEADARVSIRADLAGDDHELVVEDSGMGMERDVLERIFEPFFTTKEVGRGTGLGLATVWHLVQACGGRIAVESTPGRGTTFRILLPDKPLAAERPALSASA
jgi:signal transduction histidine kinase